jgi:hypothetical protein
VTEPEELAGLRDRALLTLGFAMMPRRSDLVGLDLADVWKAGPDLLDEVHPPVREYLVKCVLDADSVLCEAPSSSSSST